MVACPDPGNSSGLVFRTKMELFRRLEDLAMTDWILASESLPDDLVLVWVSDGKAVGISEYMHGHEAWHYSDAISAPITHWQPIEYPEAP